MRKKNLLLLSIILVVAIVALVSCDEDVIKKNEGLGNWQHVGFIQGGEAIYDLEIKSDLSCKMISRLPYETSEATGHWVGITKTTGVLYLNIGDDIYVASFDVNGNVMTVDPSNPQEESRDFVRVLK